MRLSTILLTVTLLANLIGTHAQAPRRSSDGFAVNFDNYIRKSLERLPEMPGIAVVVIKDDKPIFVRAYGYADKEAGVKADTDTLYYIASSTKSFTALAASMLDKEGKIRFSDPIVKYSTGITFKNPIPEKVTVRDLLIHTSGLRNDPLTNRLAYTGQIAQPDIDRVFAEATTFNEPAFGKYAYTNLGYNVYGLLLQYSLKKKWQDLLQERIFDPAGLKHTTAYISRAKAKKWNAAAPYILDPASGTVMRSVLNKTDDNMQSAGGMYMSISDLGRWINLNMNGGKLDGKQVIPADLIQTVHTGYTQSTRNEPPFSGDGEYGLGWQIGKYKTDKVIYHHGGFPGYRSHISFMPDRRIGVGVLVNNDIPGSRVADLLATYAYDWWSNAETFDADYAKQLDDLVKTYETRKAQVHAAALERAKRTWQLSKPFGDYAGTYSNDIAGTIEIAEKQNALSVRMGNVNTISTPYTEKDTIRVEMLPGGNGEVMKFNKDADDKVVSITYSGITFTRVP